LTRLLARHPLVAGFVLFLLFVPVLDVVWIAACCVMVGGYHAFPCGSLFVEYEAFMLVYGPTAFAWPLICVGPLALLRRRSGAPMGPVFLLVPLASVQLFIETTIVGCLLYGISGGFGVLWILDDWDIMGNVSLGVPLSASGALVGIALACAAAGWMRRTGRWEVIRPAGVHKETVERLLARWPVTGATVIFAVCVAAVFPVFCVSLSCLRHRLEDWYGFWNVVDPGVLWLLLSAVLAAVVTANAERAQRPRRMTGRTLARLLVCFVLLGGVLYGLYAMLVVELGGTGDSYWHALDIFMRLPRWSEQKAFMTIPSLFAAPAFWWDCVAVSAAAPAGALAGWGLMHLRRRQGGVAWSRLRGHA